MLIPSDVAAPADTSEVYLAEPLDPRSDAHVDLPRRVALKIACDKLDEYPGAYTPGLVVQIFEDQKEYMRRIEGAGGHPLIAKGYPDALPEVRDTTIADPACCTLKMLQEVGVASLVQRGTIFLTLATWPPQCGISF